jgi:hypothetical protein
MDERGLSARARDRIPRVARTRADLGGEEHLKAAHVVEAIGYRSRDRKPWRRSDEQAPALRGYLPLASGLPFTVFTPSRGTMRIW